ncbi:hypothetical protein QAD02_000273 [Eretmocerus hayati]|uniref:Uncharacterized protein n=1 Tax=Eretmocerus hayati TaxID=131215 RepID=A0ACC2ND83_9HYME|nr:hypothetical protein QAD02_000273 [Eretmocerus hayati]
MKSKMHYLNVHVAVYLVVLAAISVLGHEPIYGQYVHGGNEKIITSQGVYEDGDTYVFATCDDSKFPEELDCAVFTNRITEIDLKKCPLHRILPSNRHLESKEFDLKLHFLGDSTNIIIYWGEKDPTNVKFYIEVAIMNMSSCRANFVQLFTYPEVPVMDLVVYNDTFDVITFAEPRVCESKKRCRVTFNSQGQQIGSPHPFPIWLKDITIFPKLTYSGSGGFYIFDWGNNETSDSRLFYLGSDYQLKELEIEDGPYKRHPEPVVSIGYRKLVISGWQASKKSNLANNMVMIRSRFDIEDNEELAPFWSDDKLQNVKAMAVYSLPSDNKELFQLFITDAGKGRQMKLSLQHHLFTEVRYDVIAETFDFPTSGDIQEIKAHIAEIGAEYCIYSSSVYFLGSPEKRVESTLKYYKKCIPKNYAYGK